MKNLLIIGARRFGREIFNMAHDCNGFGSEFIIKGFLDDKKDALDNFNGYVPIIDSVENYEIQENDVFICALGDVNYKKKYVDIILSKKGEFINLIHKTATISRNTILGKGCIVCGYVGLSCDVKIGDFVTFQPFTCIGHDVCIGDYCHLNTYSFLGGSVSVGNFVTIHTNAVIHPHVLIEDYSTVGASSVVIRKVKSGTTVFGNPAKKLDF